jgi:hypothetical protein
MAETPKDKGLDEAFARMKEKVAQEVEQHKAEDVDLEDLEDVSGGWKISYETDPPKP